MTDWNGLMSYMRFLKEGIEKKLTEDIRGTRYRIEGPSKDERLIHVVCRFKEEDNLVIIIVYAL